MSKKKKHLSVSVSCVELCLDGAKVLGFRVCYCQNKYFGWKNMKAE